MIGKLDLEFHSCISLHSAEFGCGEKGERKYNTQIAIEILHKKKTKQ